MKLLNLQALLRLLALNFLFITAPWASAEQGGRSPKSEEAESAARDLFSNGDYDKAVPILVGASSEEPSDVRLLSLLGEAYLYSSSRIDSAANLAHAQPTMEKAIDHGGEAVFIVGKGEDKLKTGPVIKAVMGELKIAKDGISFAPRRGSGEGTGQIARDDIKECGLNRSYGKDSNTFHIKTTHAEFDFRPFHFSKEEAGLVCALTAKYFNTRTGK